MEEGGFQAVALGIEELAVEVASARAKTLRSSKAQTRLSIFLIVRVSWTGCASAPIPKAERASIELIFMLKRMNDRSECITKKNEKNGWYEIDFEVGGRRAALIHVVSPVKCHVPTFTHILTKIKPISTTSEI